METRSIQSYIPIDFWNARISFSRQQSFLLFVLLLFSLFSEWKVLKLFEDEKACFKNRMHLVVFSFCIKHEGWINLFQKQRNHQNDVVIFHSSSHFGTKLWINQAWIGTFIVQKHQHIPVFG